MKTRIAIIGAGISGLTLAMHLRDHAEVTVFEKARGVGGRMSTRHAAPFSFDHGAQFFTVRSAAFKQFLAPYLTAGLVQPWQGQVVNLQPDQAPTERIWQEPHYVAVPGMNQLCKQLGTDSTIVLNCELAPITKQTKQGWQLLDKQGHMHGYFDWVISTAPTEQTHTLFANILPAAKQLPQDPYVACFALMLGWQTPWQQPWIAASVSNSPIQWIAVNSSKPQRDKRLTALVVHSAHAWAQAHLATDRQEITAILHQTLQSLLPFAVSEPSYCALHLWRYALLDRKLPMSLQYPPYFNPDLQLASVGDWCSRSRIEDAWQNATDLLTHFGLCAP